MNLKVKLELTKDGVEYLAQVERALKLACKAIDIKSECPYWNETPIADCPSNVVDFPCGRNTEDCWEDYFMEEAKQ